MHLKVMTPQKLYVDEDVESATIPTREGEITVLSGHDFVVTVLKPGRFYFYRKTENGQKKKEALRIGEGCAEITHDEVMVYTRSVKSEEER